MGHLLLPAAFTAGTARHTHGVLLYRRPASVENLRVRRVRRYTVHVRMRGARGGEPSLVRGPASPRRPTHTPSWIGRDA